MTKHRKQQLLSAGIIVTAATVGSLIPFKLITGLIMIFAGVLVAGVCYDGE